MQGIEVSVIIPLYNDRLALQRAMPASIQTLEQVAHGFEILIAEDGSTDGSADLAREWAVKDPRVRHLHADRRLGRGTALSRACVQAQGEILCYYDVDLATDLAHLADVIGAIRAGYDIVTGSRLLPQSDVVRSGGREVASRGYNFLVRIVLGSRLYDHQCGFKAFRRESLLPLLPKVRDGHWFWDTELLVLAQHKGLRVGEVPVHWHEGCGTTVRKNDITAMGTAVLRLWWRLHVAEG
ncbi:MAG: glycosyltransferase family 2 protein [Methanomicrobiales archaeon]|nr:glycosyltransferase family 2 protein [Methanomicrobiales archaeon]